MDVLWLVVKSFAVLSIFPCFMRLFRQSSDNYNPEYVSCLYYLNNKNNNKKKIVL